MHISETKLCLCKHFLHLTIKPLQSNIYVYTDLQKQQKALELKGGVGDFFLEHNLLIC